MNSIKEVALYSVLIGSLTFSGQALAQEGRLEGKLQGGNLEKQEQTVDSTYVSKMEQFENGNEPFNFLGNLLRDYPEMQVLTGMPIKDAPQDSWNVSNAYRNLRRVESFLDDVSVGRSTGSVEYCLQLAGEDLDKLTATGKYDRFVATEKQKFDQLSNRASELIGSKVRGSDAVYK